jgi:F-type H+-transporting ATPase subunit delta
MTNPAVVSRYANALADAVTSPGSGLTAENALAELRSFDAAMAASHELGQVLVTPAVPGSRKRAAVGRIADILKLSRMTRNFLFVLIDKGRITSLADIIHAFETVADERLGLARADVASARELTDTQRSALTSQLERMTGKRIRARYSVNEALIGGAVARIGSTVYDGSVRGQLQALGARLGTES